ncbi:hypothetical protein LEAN103870_18210 [Legionella anisa]|uniref:Uncharacterized protein n=1 Tax=Legionella anisa TaxID=28082 RepID=A0AAX0WSM0_9GAMM|nr:hypothetical protein [Legionella anisa]AWN75045.1 hypothetical protein DLD14_15025 [Legionella anisa]KTC69251.1 hypothetical protein Lani_2744 [Legionella anisa]MBN5934380.1 hypothetical protein [Legionella anisa]MCW8424751.1 hypothetical protein [Legionella anisa]MCW8446130.1 hypothetical protein [Legionella anisa]
MPGFFSKLGSTWDQYSNLRSKYAELIPIPNPSYFKPIHEKNNFRKDFTEDCADLIVRPIYCPIWLGVNALLLFLKSFIYLVASLLLVVPACLCAIFSPNSNVSKSTCSAFTTCLAEAVIDATMGIVASCAAVAAIVFNPIYLLTRALSTVVEHIDAVTKSCCCA